MVNSTDTGVQMGGLDSPLFDPMIDLTSGTNTGTSETGINNIVSGLTGGALTAATSLINLIPALVSSIAATIREVETLHPEKIIGRFLTQAPKYSSFLDSISKGTWQWMSDNTVGQFYKEMLTDGLLVDVDKFDEAAMNGVKVVDTMLGFAFLMPLMAAGIDSVGKTLLANRWPHYISEYLKALPEELGMNWPMGMQIEEAFKIAVGRSIEEGINRQKRGNRIEWPVLRTMLRQNIFAGFTIDSKGQVTGSSKKVDSSPGDTVLRGLLENQGFPDEQIDWIMQLADALLPVGDVQAMYLADIFDDNAARTHLKRLGFSDDNVDHLMQLYVDKAMTQAGRQYAAVYRTLFENHQIDKTTYVDALKTVNFPAREIDLDTKAIEAVHKYGRIANTTASIKSQLLHGSIDTPTAVQQLILMNYAPDAATATVNSWLASPILRQHRLSQSTVLSYYRSGLMNRSDAQTRLINLALNPQDVTFLLNNPSAASGATVRKLTPSLVIQAYIDRVIQESDLVPDLAKAGVSQDDMSYWVGIAKYKLAHHKVTPTPPLSLDKAEIRGAYKYGLLDLNDAQQRLENLGYSEHEAFMLLEITNRGEITPAAPPIFATLNDAIDYLLSQGYSVTPPPDPKLIAAESMVAAAGYGYTPIQAGVQGGTGQLPGPVGLP